MAVKIDEQVVPVVDSVYPTDTIISKNARKHYKIPIQSQHWQLRSLIGAQKRHYVYFPAGHGCNQIQRLNVETRECETIKLLNFAPRCLVARNGWLCCGSETGEFVAIRLEQDAEDHTVAAHAAHGPAYDAAARLARTLERPLDDSLLSLLSLPPLPRQSTKGLLAKSMKLAKDRVNCITLWFPSDSIPLAEGAYTEPIAILANNDKTVTLVSLLDFDKQEKTEALDVIEFPDYANRAAISPDGQLLVTVSDDAFLYIHKRIPKTPGSEAWNDPREYQWKDCHRFMLPSQGKYDRSDNRGSFAISFSPSGAHLAVGTQYGIICIFDVTRVHDAQDDALLTTFESSRPYTVPGAVRDMEFCPGPYDILAWTEDRGRIGVADARSNFRVRQILDINEESEFEHISMDRYMTGLRHSAHLQHMRDIQSIREVRARSQGLRSEDIRDWPYGRDYEGLEAINRPWSATETRVLEAITSEGRRARERAAQRERGAQRDQGASAVQRESVTRAAEAERRSTILGRLAEELQRNQARASNSGPASVPAAPPVEADAAAGTASSDNSGQRSQDISQIRQQQRERIHERYQHIRSALPEGGNRSQTQQRPRQRVMDSIHETVEAIRDSTDRSDSWYMYVLELLQRHTGGLEADDAAMWMPLVNTVVTRWEESAIRGTLPPPRQSVFDVPPEPDNTAGIGWSEDGRTLFIGAQNGIYEFQVNLQARKLFPTVNMR